jgi:hypothetical protein
MLGAPKEEAPVAVAFIQEFRIINGDTSTTNYDSISAKLGRDKPSGLIAHTAGFDTDAGVFRIFDVWEDADSAKRFHDEKIPPFLDEMRSGTTNPEDFRPPDREGIYELHDEIH